MRLVSFWLRRACNTKLMNIKTMEKRKYSRDGRAPIPVDEKTSRLMSSIKGKDTKPELTLRKLLRESEFGGYRLHWSKAPGRPDICYPSKKIAIFVNGCFWHRCPKCNLPVPKSHSDYWILKLEKNVQRDIKKQLELKQHGWNVFIFWECEIQELPKTKTKTFYKLIQLLEKFKNSQKTINNGKEKI